MNLAYLGICDNGYKRDVYMQLFEDIEELFELSILFILL